MKSSEPDESAERLHLLDLCDQAMALLRAVRQSGRMTRGDRPHQIHAAQLFRANHNNSKSVRGALLSAVHELEGTAAARVTAVEVLRIAYNRSRRQQRQQDRIARAAERGEAAPARGKRANGERILDLQTAHLNEIREISAQVEELLGSLYKGLDERDRRILMLAAAGHSQSEIAAMIGCHRTGVSRVISRVRDRYDSLQDDAAK